MSEKESVSENIQFEYKAPELLDNKAKAKMLPDPSGFRLLIAPAMIEEKTKGGIVIPEERQKVEQAASAVGMVLKMGPDAYSDKERFPSGPWCKEGDFVMFAPYSGTTYNIHGVDLRMINDDSVEGVVEDPRGISRVVR